MTLQVVIDGDEVTDVVQEGTSTRRLNKTATATVKIPIDRSVEGIGLRMKVYIDGELEHHGLIKQVSDDDGEDGDGTTEYTSYDAREIWESRPARDGDGDFSLPSFLEDFVSGPQIMEEILHNSEVAGGGGPDDSEGPLFIEFGSFEAGGADLSGAPTDWPMTIEEIASLLCDTGELDIVLTPIDTGGNMARVDCYNGDFGTDLSSSVSFQYATGSNNARRCRRTEDMGNMCNKLWYYLGPNKDSQHWTANLTGTDTRPVSVGGPPEPPQASIVSASLDSRVQYGVRMDIRIYDQNSDDNSAKPLYWRLWQEELFLRMKPRTLVFMTPVRGLEPTFDIGDLITVEAGTAFRGGFSGVQRVYARTVQWDEDGVIDLGELVTSPDGDS